MVGVVDPFDEELRGTDYLASFTKQWGKPKSVHTQGTRHCWAFEKWDLAVVYAGPTPVRVEYARPRKCAPVDVAADGDTARARCERLIAATGARSDVVLIAVEAASRGLKDDAQFCLRKSIGLKAFEPAESSLPMPADFPPTKLP
ncbi:MAG: hypothetical protein JNM17_22900 [Archangium sp.]|nr:hypothetical protein [Archangium sp.]